MSITQDTFDEVVKEGMEDFGMDRKGAAEHFVEKFKGHHVSLVTTSFCSSSRRVPAKQQGGHDTAVSFEYPGMVFATAVLLHARPEAPFVRSAARLGI